MDKLNVLSIVNIPLTVPHKKIKKIAINSGASSCKEKVPAPTSPTY